MNDDRPSGDPGAGSGARAGETSDEARDAIALLEHLTGPSRGRTCWLGGAAVDILLTPNRFVRVAEASPGAPRAGLVARLHRAGDTYEIQAIEGASVWVNGDSVTARRLRHEDVIELGPSGPLSRFTLHREDEPVRATAGRILRDAAAYLRASRQPVVPRCGRACAQVAGRLLGQTTVLFRTGVVIALVVLAGIAYQQSRINALLEERIEAGASRLEDFAAVLARARKEALTPGDLQALRGELAGRLTTAAERLKALEERGTAAKRVIAGSAPSILFVQGAYGFRETSTKRMLRQAVDADGSPVLSPLGQPLLTLDGDGPVAERQFTGSAFAVGDAGLLVTNRHVALPWEADGPGYKLLAGQGLEAVMIKFVAYPPGRATAGEVEVLRVSEAADLAVLRYADTTKPPPGLVLAATPPKAGDEAIVMGYPAGLRSMLAQSGDAFIGELQKANDIGFWSVATRLAERGYIAPLASRGIVGRVTEETIVYDAETTHGGSGGPVLDMNGAVIGVNTAVLPEFGGSNLGVPVGKLRALLAAGEAS